MHDDVDATVAEVASLVLGVPVEQLRRRREEIPEWDSLKHVALLFAVEDACGVRFDPEQLVRLDSTSSIISAVKDLR